MCNVLEYHQGVPKNLSKRLNVLMKLTCNSRFADTYIAKMGNYNKLFVVCYNVIITYVLIHNSIKATSRTAYAKGNKDMHKTARIETCT